MGRAVREFWLFESFVPPFPARRCTAVRPLQRSGRCRFRPLGSRLISQDPPASVGGFLFAPRTTLTTPAPSRNVARPEANRLEERMMEKWTLEIGDRDYLDGIQSGHMVRADNGSPVAYMFDDARARLATAAPDLLEALLECRDAEMRRSAKLKPGAPATTYTEVRLARIDAAIARATGADQ